MIPFDASISVRLTIMFDVRSWLSVNIVPSTNRNPPCKVLILSLIITFGLDFTNFDDLNRDELITTLWRHLGKVAIQTRTKGKGVAEKPLILDKGATVHDVVKKVHKDFLKKFKYAKIWGPSAAFSGQTCGFDHELADGDIVEIFVK